MREKNKLLRAKLSNKVQYNRALPVTHSRTAAWSTAGSQSPRRPLRTRSLCTSGSVSWLRFRTWHCIHETATTSRPLSWASVPLHLSSDPRRACRSKCTSASFYFRCTVRQTRVALQRFDAPGHAQADNLLIGYLVPSSRLGAWQEVSRSPLRDLSRIEGAEGQNCCVGLLDPYRGVLIGWGDSMSPRDPHLLRWLEETTWFPVVMWDCDCPVVNVQGFQCPNDVTALPFHVQISPHVRDSSTTVCSECCQRDRRPCHKTSENRSETQTVSLLDYPPVRSIVQDFLLLDQFRRN